MNQPMVADPGVAQDRVPGRVLVRGASSVVTLAGPPGPRRGPALDAPGVLVEGAVGIVDGTIVAVGSEAHVLAAMGEPEGVIDAEGGLIVPGFVDPHTHLVFAGHRADEFEARLVSDTSFLALIQGGSGSLRTVAATRAASDELLTGLLRQRLDRMLEHGTTTVEVKTGYGLTVEEELRHLRLIDRLRGNVHAGVVATALPTHFRPPEHRADVEPYLDAVCERFIPVVAAERLATSVDVFCEPGAYSVEQARRVLTVARRHGLGGRVHADQLSDGDGAALAAEMGALSADHLGHISPRGVAALAAARTVAVLVPGSLLLVPGEATPPVRAMIDAGVAVAITTDYNPGTSPIVSQAVAMTLSCALFRMTAAEALAAATINAAEALGLGHLAGSLEPGKRGDLVILEAQDHREIPYRVGQNLVRQVVVGGRRVVTRGAVGPL